MRIYCNPVEAVREVERDLFEMAITVHPQTMQDKFVGDDPAYETKEVQGYAFKIADWNFSYTDIEAVLEYFFEENWRDASNYVLAEINDRTCQVQLNPGNSYKWREKLWTDFMHHGKFAYTYSERIAPQFDKIMTELKLRPETRQAIINIHSNICPSTIGNNKNIVTTSADVLNMGGSGRIPCSMYYQLMIRNKKLDLIYTMRSCDFLTHFPIDISLALCLQKKMAEGLMLQMGTFTYFTGSLHAYKRDMCNRGIF